MTLYQRLYQGEADWDAAASLIHADPQFYHPIDYPWRLCSTTLENHQNAAVWLDQHGQVVAFAALQFAWLTLDYALLPTARSPEIEAQVIHWAETRLRQIAAETRDSFPFNVSAYRDQPERIRWLEAQGYQQWEHHMVVMRRSLAHIPHSPPAAGFTIRLLAGTAEIESYVALQRTVFESQTMTAAWRSRTLHAPLYDPELDLVAVAPDGRLVGFCIWWYQPALKTAQIEPLGVHPDFQHLGLAQALMAEGMRRAARRGATQARVETYSFSEPALKAYQTAGFEVVHHELKLYKDYDPA